MGNCISANYNNWFGENITTVANAYPLDVWVCFHTDGLRLENLQAKMAGDLQAEASVKIGWKKSIQNTFVRLPGDDFHRMRRKTSWERMSIVDGYGNLLLFNYQIAANGSFIITRNGAIKFQKYGSTNYFADDDGFIHKSCYGQICG